MQTQVEVNSEKLLQTFLEMVRIDSPSGGEAEFCTYLKAKTSELGLSYTEDASGNLIFEIPGNRNADCTLIMTGHMDVVPPCLGVKPIVEGEGDDCVIRSSGDTVLGADDKSALAPMYEALEMSFKYNLPRPNLLFLITVREEVLLAGANEMDTKHYAHADFAIALDHTGQQGTLIYEAPSYYEFKMTVHGKSVHAGIMPEKGINAIQILSQALEPLSFGRLDENTTSNLGFIRGGKATNIVPDLAIVEGEVRGHDDARIQQELDLYEQTLRCTVDPIEGASAEFEYKKGFQHYRTDPEHPSVQKVIKASQQLNLPLNLIRTNGGSDVNVFAERGVPGIVLSAGYIEPHSLTERVYLKDMVTMTHLILGIWEQFATP